MIGCPKLYMLQCMLGIINLVSPMKGIYKLFKFNPKLSSVSGPVMLEMPEKEPMMLSMSLVVVVIMLVSMFLVMFYVGRWYLIYTRKNTRKKVKKCLVTVEYCSDFNINILLSIIL